MLEQIPLADISLRELSRQVGLSKSNVVRYFPTLEAVFLAVLIDDWGRWLDVLAGRLPASSERGTPARRHAVVGAAIAETVGARPRLCGLIASAPVLLERHIPVETARDFKAAALAHTARLAGLVICVVPELDDGQAFEFAGVVWALIVGAWPMARPSPTVAQVLAEPEFAGMCIDFVPTLGRLLTVLLAGLTAGSSPVPVQGPAGPSGMLPFW